ncbi:hypothetical protein QYF36_021070 [Acer negundo]|nr:hypothetical protein QYF36_021070 [Acer negundo]
MLGIYTPTIQSIKEVPTKCPRSRASKDPKSFTVDSQIVFTDFDFDKSIPYAIDLTSFNNISKHVLDHVGKTSGCLGRPSRVLPNVKVATLVGDVGTSLVSDIDQGQTSAAPSRTIPKVDPTIGQGSTTHVADACGEVTP